MWQHVAGEQKSAEAVVAYSATSGDAKGQTFLTGEFHVMTLTRPTRTEASSWSLDNPDTRRFHRARRSLSEINRSQRP